MSRLQNVILTSSLARKFWHSRQVCICNELQSRMQAKEEMFDHLARDMTKLGKKAYLMRTRRL